MVEAVYSHKQVSEDCASHQRGSKFLSNIEFRHNFFVDNCNTKFGYTVVELMVTIVVVSVLAATVGMFFVKLLTIQEREREEAYVREKLSDICGAYADFMSIGSSFSTATNLPDKATVVKYRQETGGVSLETGLVSRVAYLTSLVNTTNKTINLNIIYSTDEKDPERRFSTISRIMRGDAPLIPLTGDMVSIKITPLNFAKEDTDNDFAGFKTTDAVLGNLEVTVLYKIKNDEGIDEERTVKVERLVRLWNRE